MSETVKNALDEKRKKLDDLRKKRLEQQRFPWPELTTDDAVLKLTSTELDWLLRGIDFFRLKPHKTLRFASVG